MIKNDIELNISKDSLEEFLSTLQNMEHDDSYKELSIKKREIYRRAIIGEMESLQNQINEYNMLKKGKLQDVLSDRLTDLPLNLIRARIANGYDETFVAEKLSIDVSEYIELEEELFADADTKTIIKLISLLNLEVPTELQKMFSFDSQQLKRNFKKSMGSLFDKLLPYEIKEDYNITNGYLKLFASLKKVFNDHLDEILSGSRFTPNMLTNARYKTPKGTRDELVYLYTSYAEFIAREISKVLKTPTSKLTTDPRKFRNSILEIYGDFNLKTCISYLWNLGVPIIPFEMSGGFHGACWRFNGRNVIVLKQQSKSESRWLFDLLHEYWHATQEPDLQERRKVDLGEVLSTRSDDKEELDANDFAKAVIFGGKSEELFEECMTISKGKIKLLKAAVLRVALKNSVDVGALANYIAFRMSNLEYNWWGAAQNLQPKGKPYSIAYEIMLSELDPTLLDSIDDPMEQEILQNAIYY